MVVWSLEKCGETTSQGSKHGGVHLERKNARNQLGNHVVYGLGWVGSSSLETYSEKRFFINHVVQRMK
jgi:hypothetical protein